jgi:hypothetical protein
LRGNPHSHLSPLPHSSSFSNCPLVRLCPSCRRRRHGSTRFTFRNFFSPNLQRVQLVSLTVRARITLHFFLSSPLLPAQPPLPSPFVISQSRVDSISLYHLLAPLNTLFLVIATRRLPCPQRTICSRAYYNYVRMQEATATATENPLNQFNFFLKFLKNKNHFRANGDANSKNRDALSTLARSLSILPQKERNPHLFIKSNQYFRSCDAGLYSS